MLTVLSTIAMTMFPLATKSGADCEVVNEQLSSRSAESKPSCGRMERNKDKECIGVTRDELVTLGCETRLV